MAQAFFEGTKHAQDTRNANVVRYSRAESNSRWATKDHLDAKLAELRGDIKDAVHDQTKTFIGWLFVVVSIGVAATAGLTSLIVSA